MDYKQILSQQNHDLKSEIDQLKNALQELNSCEKPLSSDRRKRYMFPVDSPEQENLPLQSRDMSGSVYDDLSLQKEIDALAKVCEASRMYCSQSHSELSPVETRALKKTFESCYLSDEDTEPQAEHEPTATQDTEVGSSDRSTYRDKVIAQELARLKRENEYLRQQLDASQKPSRMSFPIRARPRSRSKSRKRSTTPSQKAVKRSQTPSMRQEPTYEASPYVSRLQPKRALSSANGIRQLSRKRRSMLLSRSPIRRHLTPTRKRHCDVCAKLLSKGYSTSYCSTHGSSRI